MRYRPLPKFFLKLVLLFSMVACIHLCTMSIACPLHVVISTNSIFDGKSRANSANHPIAVVFATLSLLLLWLPNRIKFSFFAACSSLWNHSMFTLHWQVGIFLLSFLYFPLRSALFLSRRASSLLLWLLHNFLFHSIFFLVVFLFRTF